MSESLFSLLKFVRLKVDILVSCMIGAEVIKILVRAIAMNFANRTASFWSYILWTITQSFIFMSQNILVLGLKKHKGYCEFKKTNFCSASLRFMWSAGFRWWAVCTLWSDGFAEGTGIAGNGESLIFVVSGIIPWLVWSANFSWWNCNRCEQRIRLIFPFILWSVDFVW